MLGHLPDRQHSLDLVADASKADLASDGVLAAVGVCVELRALLVVKLKSAGQSSLET